MRVSTKGDYGIRALIELAHHWGQPGPVQSGEIAARQGIPEAYLEQLLTILRRAGFIRSVRGPQGGHALIRDPDEVKVLEVITVLEGPVVPVDCLDETSRCSISGGCAQREMWGEVRDAIVDILERTSIGELAAKDRQATVAGGRYVI
jgi:Rrf2 family protein